MESEQTPVIRSIDELRTVSGVDVVDIEPLGGGEYSVRLDKPVPYTLEDPHPCKSWIYDALGKIAGPSGGPDHPSNLNLSIEVLSGDCVLSDIESPGPSQTFECLEELGIPTTHQGRKETPIYSGVIMYFPDAVAEVAKCSYIGNEQHHPGTPLHWDKSKSADEHDALIRHIMGAGGRDPDGVLESAKVAWRALAALQREIDATRSESTT